MCVLGCVFVKTARFSKWCVALPDQSTFNRSLTRHVMKNQKFGAKGNIIEQYSTKWDIPASFGRGMPHFKNLCYAINYC